MSNNLRDEKLSHGNGEPAGASEPNPDPNAHLDAVIPGDEPEETTVKGRIEEFAARFRRPVESARDQKSGDRLRGALILVATAIGCLFLFFGLFTTTTDPSKKRAENAAKPGEAADGGRNSRNCKPIVGSAVERHAATERRNRGTYREGFVGNDA